MESEDFICEHWGFWFSCLIMMIKICNLSGILWPMLSGPAPWDIMHAWVPLPSPPTKSCLSEPGLNKNEIHSFNLKPKSNSETAPDTTCKLSSFQWQDVWSMSWGNGASMWICVCVCVSPLQAARLQTEGVAVSSVLPSDLAGGGVVVCPATSSTKTAGAAWPPVSHATAKPSVLQRGGGGGLHLNCSTSHHDTMHFYSSGPPPYLLVANLVDVREIHPEGTRDQTLVEDPRGTIIALDYDPVQKIVR